MNAAMFTRPWLVTTAAVLAAGLATGAAAVLSPAAAAPAATAAEQTLSFHDTTTASTLTDLDHNGAPGPGDYVVSHEQAAQGGSVVEHNDSQCLVGFADEFLCHVVVDVHGRGEVILDGSVAAPGGAFPADFDLAVTGGTGEFATAQGCAQSHRVSDTESDDMLTLRP